MRATFARLVSNLAARASWLSPSAARRTAISLPKISSPRPIVLLPLTLVAAGRLTVSTAEAGGLSSRVAFRSFVNPPATSGVFTAV
jgi:hypothetical protein